MKLTSDQVKHAAKLANLSLSSEEDEKYSAQLSKILAYIDKLNQVDTLNVEPTFNVTPNQNIMGEDQTEMSLSQEDATDNGSNTKEGFFVTKGVFEQ